MPSSLPLPPRLTTALSRTLHCVAGETRGHPRVVLVAPGPAAPSVPHVLTLHTLFARPAPAPQVKHVVIPSWYARPGYVRAMADLIQAEVARPEVFPEQSAAEIFFSAHGVPVSYIEEGASASGQGPPAHLGGRASGCGWVGREGRQRPPAHSAAPLPPCLPPPLPRPPLLPARPPAHPSPLLLPVPSPPGDPYKEEMEECVALVMAELRRRGVANHHTLAYQSRVGPVEWLKPYTDDSIRWVHPGGAGGGGGGGCACSAQASAAAASSKQEVA